MADRTTFRLPGHQLNPLAERKSHLSLLAAYSRQWNPRNLEAPWYEFWTQIFADLVAQHTSLSAAPQIYLWYDLDHKEPVHTAPGPHFFLSTEDEQLDGLAEDAGNTTLDSIKSTSIHSHRNRHRIPDIAITRKVSFARPGHTAMTDLFHLARRVTYLGIPLLAELKTSGARCKDIYTSLHNAQFPMLLAREQVMQQAVHLFHMYPHQDSVILVAISGFWWSYQIFTRQLATGIDVVDGECDSEAYQPNEEPDPMGLDQNGVHADLAEALLSSDSSEASPSTTLPEHLYGFTPDLSALESISACSTVTIPFHTALPANAMKLRNPGAWSDCMLYGTAASNQVLSLLLDRLHSIVHVHYDGKMG